MLPPLPDNLAAQKAFSDALLSKNLTQSISVLVPGKPRRGSPGLGSPAAPAPPPLQAAAASPPPKPGRPACHCFLDLGGPIRGGFLNSNFWLPAFAQEAPSEGEGRLRRKLEGRQIRVAGVEAVAGLEGGDTVTPKMPLHAQSLNQFTTKKKEGGTDRKQKKKDIRHKSK